MRNGLEYECKITKFMPNKHFTSMRNDLKYGEERIDIGNISLFLDK